MKSLTLTPKDVGTLAMSMQDRLGQLRYQYSLLAPKFPTVTPDALEAMKATIAKDPVGAGTAPDTHPAVYFAALSEMAAQQLEFDIGTLAQANADAATVLSLFQWATACANYISALSLLSNGELVSQLYYDEAQADARKAVASQGAIALHALNADAKKWVLAEWTERKAEFKNNKTAFARKYVDQVKERYPKARAGFETIKDDWLPKG